MLKGVCLLMLGGVMCGAAVWIDMNVVNGAIQEIEAILIGFCGLLLIAAGCVIDELSNILTELKKRY